MRYVEFVILQMNGTIQTSGKKGKSQIKPKKIQTQRKVNGGGKRKSKIKRTKTSATKRKTPPKYQRKRTQKSKSNRKQTKNSSKKKKLQTHCQRKRRSKGKLKTVKKSLIEISNNGYLKFQVKLFEISNSCLKFQITHKHI